MNLRLVGISVVAVCSLVALSALGTWRFAHATGPDVNNDGRVTIQDILEVIHHYFEYVPTPPPSETPTPAATVTDTPGPTPTPSPYDVSFYGPAHTNVGQIISFSIALRNLGSESADLRLNFFGAMTLGNDPSVFTPLCVYTGTSPGVPSQTCTGLEDFNSAGVNGLGFGGVVPSNEAIWATFTGYFNTATGQLPFIAEATWHYAGNALSASGNELVEVKACC
jgi:hypothetical protein